MWWWLDVRGVRTSMKIYYLIIKCVVGIRTFRVLCAFTSEPIPPKANCGYSSPQSGLRCCLNRRRHSRTIMQKSAQKKRAGRTGRGLYNMEEGLSSSAIYKARETRNTTPKPPLSVLKPNRCFFFMQWWWILMGMANNWYMAFFRQIMTFDLCWSLTPLTAITTWLHVFVLCAAMLCGVNSKLVFMFDTSCNEA